MVRRLISIVFLHLEAPHDPCSTNQCRSYKNYCLLTILTGSEKLLFISRMRPLTKSLKKKLRKCIIIGIAGSYWNANKQTAHVVMKDK